MSKMSKLFRSASHYSLLIVAGRISHMPRLLDLSLISILIIGVVFLYRDFLLGSASFNHDSILWYGMFHYFAESLINGSWPYWNPYVHGGEPFFYAWNIIRLADPITLFLIFIAAPFNPDLFTLYNYNFIVRIIIASVGSYFFLRSLLTRNLSLVSVSLLAVWGPLGGQSLGVIGNLDGYCWFPWLLWSLVKILRADCKGYLPSPRRGRWILLAAWFFAIMVGGAVYHWAYGGFVIFLFLITLAGLNWEFLKRILLDNKVCIALGFILILLMSSPLAVLYFERDEIYPSAREIHRHHASDTVLGVSYEDLASRNPQIGLGSLKSVKALFTFNSAQGFGNYAGGDNVGLWLFGKVACLFLLLGVFFGKHRLRWPLFVGLCGSIFMWVGPQPYFGWLYKLVYFSFPPLWLTRHQSLFEPFCLILLICFVGLGIDRLCEFITSKKVRDTFLVLRRKRHFKTFFLFINMGLSGGVVATVVYMMFGQSNVAKVGGFQDLAVIVALVAAGVIVLFCVLLSKSVRVSVFYGPALFLPLILVLQVVEQSILAMNQHRDTDTCLHSWKCDWDYYFDDFIFPRKAVDGFVFPERRNVGLNLSKSYFSYAPAIFKNNVALEDIMPASPPPFGSGRGIHLNFGGTNFPLGLYHFWLKDYLRIYEIGEWQPKTFSALMGINQPLVNFKTHYALSPPAYYDESGLADSFWKESDGAIVSEILNHFVIMEPDQAGANGSLDIRDIFSNLKAGQSNLSQPTLIREVSKELFDGTGGKALPPNWVFHGPDLQGWRIQEAEDGSARSGKVLYIPVSALSPNLARFNTDDLDLIPKGNSEVRVEVWVKSQNKTQNAVTVDIQTKRGIGPVAIQDYSNSGKWEKIVLSGLVEDSSDYLLVTLHVRGDATAGAEFAEVNIDIVELPEKQFRDKLESDFGLDSTSTFELLEASFSPNKLELEVITKQRGILVYRDIWTEDWRAYVNGQMRPIMKVDLAFKGVELPAGKHRVILDYHPGWFAASFYIYLTGLIVGALLCVVAAWWSRKKGKKSCLAAV